MRERPNSFDFIIHHFQISLVARCLWTVGYLTRSDI